MVDLGTDVFAVNDLDPGFRLVSGRLAHAQGIARRLLTARGDFARIGDDGTYGADLRRFVGDDVSPRVAFEVAATVEREALKDERTLSAVATVSVAGDSLLVSLRISDAAGPFSLVLAVTNVTVDLLRVT